MNKQLFLSILLICLSSFTACKPKLDPTFLSYELKVNGKVMEKDKKDKEGYYNVKPGDKITIKATVEGPKKEEAAWIMAPSKAFCGEDIESVKNDTKFPSDHVVQITKVASIRKKRTIKEAWEGIVTNNDLKKGEWTALLSFVPAGDEKYFCNKPGEGDFKLKMTIPKAGE